MDGWLIEIKKCIVRGDIKPNTRGCGTSQSLFGSKKDKAHRVSHGWQGSLWVFVEFWVTHANLGDTVDLKF